MKRKFFLSPFFLAVAMSPALFQVDYSCARGDTFLLSLELEVSGQDQIVNFSTTNPSYAVTTSSSTAILRVVTKDPNSNATYRWFAGGTAIGPALAIGVGGGQVTVTVPNGQSQLYVNVQAPEGAFDSYIVDVDRCDLCKKTITVATTNNIIVNDISIVPYTLNVLPTSPITANQPFTADLGGTVEVAEFWLDAFQGVIPGGSLDVAIVDLKATVQTRGDGATGADVALGWGSSVPFECQLTGTACDPANDEAGTPGSRGNTDCVPTGSFNPCLRFADLPTSIDCAPAGLCDSLGKATQCTLNGFCVTGSLLLPLDLVVGATYMAGDGVSSGQTEALFGWADHPPAVTAVGVPPQDLDGTWNMISPTYSGVVGDLGIRMIGGGGLSVALEGVMGVDSNGPDGPPVGVPDDASPTPDSALLCLPVGGPFVCGDGITEACEECDDIGESATCDTNCTVAVCGDSTINVTAGEICDDGVNDGTGPGLCEPGCAAPAQCGNGLIETGEECDDTGESAICDADCTAVACGDGVLNVLAGEECDDGNNVDGDGCQADCTLLAPLDSCNFVQTGSDAMPQTQTVIMGCAWNITNGQFPFPWELSVSVPAAITGDEMFTADFDGVAVFPKPFLDILQQIVPGGVATMEIVDLAATVQIRSGATGPDVLLGIDPAAVVPGLTSFCTYPPDQTCTVDGDCIVPPCKDPVLIAGVPRSEDCTTGGVCSDLGQGFGDGAGAQCNITNPPEFCVTGDLLLPMLEASGTFTADASGDVLFGWADQGVPGLVTCPSATPDCQESIMPDGSYDLPPAIYSNPTPPNGIRTNLAGALFVPFTCAMGEQGGICSATFQGCLVDADCPGGETCDPVFGGLEGNAVIMPTLDANLISCPIN